MTIQELEQFIALYGKDIYSFCVYLAGSEADDLYQDTFLEAVKKKESISKDGNPKSYLLSVSVNLWNNRKRKYDQVRKNSIYCRYDRTFKSI